LFTSIRSEFLTWPETKVSSKFVAKEGISSN
jgi:hypothetical protein